MRYPASGDIISIQHVWHHFWPISSQNFRMLPSTCILVCHHLVFSEFLCWSFRQSKLRFKLKFIIKWREAGLSRYFSTLEEKFCISVQPRNILYKSESQIKAIVISIGRKMLSFVLFLPFLPLVLLLHPKTQGKNIGTLLWIP